MAYSFSRMVPLMKQIDKERLYEDTLNLKNVVNKQR